MDAVEEADWAAGPMRARKQALAAAAGGGERKGAASRPNSSGSEKTRLPRCTFNSYSCSDCELEQGCGCGACELPEHAICANASTWAWCGAECAPGYHMAACTLTGCTECHEGDVLPLASWSGWVEAGLMLAFATFLLVLHTVRSGRWRRFRRWMRHPTVGAVGRQLDQHCEHRVLASDGDPLIAQRVECAVCLCDFATSDSVRTLPCPAAVSGHTFHRACIDQWLLAQTTCPLCNADCSVILGLRAAQATTAVPSGDVGSTSLHDLSASSGAA
eukprot:TRINITY_DN47205_c0_g1_i1.p1 TRINITY_DN47205_c0_g1~~TRINITY_DN47205_c0_g1_i1.p1  ORF type:complete len:274 (+),score=29.84 TRINITY_DN47205_c0_g1_i1:114-935(+)